MKLRMYMSPEMLITPSDDEALGGDGRSDILLGEFETLEVGGRVYLLAREADPRGYDPATIFDLAQKAAKDAARASALAKLTDEERAALGVSDAKTTKTKP